MANLFIVVCCLSACGFSLFACRFCAFGLYVSVFHRVPTRWTAGGEGMAERQTHYTPKMKLCQLLKP